MEKKDAMEILKDFHDKSALFSVRTALETLIPELAESEDESIKKDIIIVLEREATRCFKETGSMPQWYDRSIAWLEKQGDIVNHYEDKLDKCACDNFNKGYKKALEKQGEQNHNDDKDETVSKLIAIAECLEMDRDCSFNGYSGNECGKFLRKLSKTLWLEKQGEQPYWKPSEEQLQTLHAQLNEGAVTYPEDKHILFTLYEDLMKIMTQEEKQGEQKPIESDWIDLGLPSGTLWKSSNEINPKFYTYDEAMQLFFNLLPTKEQWEELKNNCQWAWAGNGYKATGPNGNSIFLPAAGYRFLNGDVVRAETYGSYWASKSSNLVDAWSFDFNRSEISIYTYDRCIGQSVRLVNSIVH